MESSEDLKIKLQGYEISEREFLDSVIDLAHVFGYLVAHFRPAMTKHGWRTAVAGDGAGYPDLCLVKSERLIYAELKSNKGKVTEQQQRWLGVLKATGKCDVYVWRPCDFQSIVEVLREGETNVNRQQLEN